MTRWTFVGKVMSLLFNMLSRLVITFLPRSKRVLISWLQSPSAVILERKKIWMIISRSIHVAVNGIISFFLWQSDIPLFVYIYNIFLIHSSVNGHLDCVHALVITNRAAVNIIAFMFLN